jgi:NAD(P)-dependent dehydrogenase (short-subunit alcohol dehydrogenase family)
MNPKTVLITGASSGIGLALAAAFLARGHNVVGNARTAERLTASALKLGPRENFLGVPGDIADAATSDALFARAAERFGPVDVLVANAGVFVPKPFADYTSAEIDAMVATNLLGFVHPVQRAARHMAARRSGHIVAITASIALQPQAGVPATLPILIKGGINSAVRALALELAPHQVKVSAVAPGIIDTPMHSPANHDFLGTLQPTGRIGRTQDIVDAVLYLTSAEFTTGVVLPVDGGMAAGRW